MNWKEYEQEIYNYFFQLYPNAEITFDAKVIGRYSKKERQVDVLIEDVIADFPIKIIVDAKYFSKNIDVKCVESFLSMIEDVNANQGLLITQKGYSEAAINRAYYGPQNLELDILNFDDLLKYQGLESIPYAGKNAIILSSPFGWIIDNRKQKDFIACLYQRGITLEQAQKKQEWMYFNFWRKDKFTSTIKDLISIQNTQMESVYTNLQIENYNSPKRKDGLDTYIRIAQFNELTCKEITGYIDCKEFIIFFVLFTPEEVQARNIRKLAYLLRYSNPIKINFNNTKVIQQLEKELSIITDPIKRAAACKQLADWYLEMDDEDNAIRYYRLCWDSDPEYYENIHPLILGELKLNNIEAAIKYSEEFFALGPKNPRVMQDLLEIYADEAHWTYFEKLITNLKNQYTEDNEALGNIYIHFAQYLGYTGQDKKSIEHFKSARALFHKVDKNHYVLQLIDQTLKEYAKEK